MVELENTDPRACRFSATRTKLVYEERILPATAMSTVELE